MQLGKRCSLIDPGRMSKMWIWKSGNKGAVTGWIVPPTSISYIEGPNPQYLRIWLCLEIDPVKKWQKLNEVIMIRLWNDIIRVLLKSDTRDLLPAPTPPTRSTLRRKVEEQVVLPLSKPGVGYSAVGDSLVAYCSRIWVLRRLLSSVLGLGCHSRMTGDIPPTFCDTPCGIWSRSEMRTGKCLPRP